MSESNQLQTDPLALRAAAGDSSAQAELLGRYRSRLRRMVEIRMDKRITARVDPSDIVQDTLKDAHSRLTDYFADPRLPFYPWLRRIAWDRLADIYRVHLGAEKRSVLREQPLVLHPNDDSICALANTLARTSSNPAHRVAQAETHARVQAALLDLKPHDREVLVLRYVEQLSVSEIAATLQVSSTTVTSRHLRALQRLRRLVGDPSGDR